MLVAIDGFQCCVCVAYVWAVWCAYVPVGVYARACVCACMYACAYVCGVCMCGVYACKRE